MIRAALVVYIAMTVSLLFGALSHLGPVMQWQHDRHADLAQVFMNPTVRPTDEPGTKK